MSLTGRYYVRAGGRLFCVEPVEGRVNESQQWRVGGADSVRGGAVPESESIITEANGFTNIKTLRVGQSPDDYINELLRLPAGATAAQISQPLPPPTPSHE